MESRAVLRLAGVATLAGAAIDMTGPLIYPRLAEPWPHLVYVLIDLLLLIGMLGVRSVSGRSTGVLGLIGFVVALAGVLLVRTSSAKIFGEASYAVSASIWSLGMVAWGVALLRAKGPFRIAGGLWIAALVSGLAGVLLKDQVPLSRLASLVFAAGFVAAGVDLWRSAGQTSGDRP